MPHETQVICNGATSGRDGRQRLTFHIGDREFGAKLSIKDLSARLVSNLPDYAIDLLELSTLVYAIDSAVSRGGPMDQHMGAKWHRRFVVEVPVRCLETFSSGNLKRDLEETLFVLSGDRFDFRFIQSEKPAEPNQYFYFGDEGQRTPDTIALFSGGLDSFAGVLEELAERNRTVALVSHTSSTKVEKLQKTIAADLKDRFGSHRVQHIPTKIQLAGKSANEGTHRTRSFLFAALAAVVAIAFGRREITFFENGIVSLNLTSVQNVVGTKATRTTHPLVLEGFRKVLGAIAGEAMNVTNPFFWHTKADVMDGIRQLGMENHIRHTNSCADVHHRTVQYPHCGVCSQCIDRRFAALACGLENYDPIDGYRIDPILGERRDAREKEMILSYIRTARRMSILSDKYLEGMFPAVASATQHLETPDQTARSMLVGLLNRHGRMVVTVANKLRQAGTPETLAENCPLNLAEQEEVQSFQMPYLVPETRQPDPPTKVKLKFLFRKKIVKVGGATELKGAQFDTLLALSDIHLDAIGRGLEFFDFPFIAVRQLAERLKLESEDAVRHRITRCRNPIKKSSATLGISEQSCDELIENSPWQGYRLNPELVHVVRAE